MIYNQDHFIITHCILILLIYESYNSDIFETFHIMIDILTKQSAGRGANQANLQK